MLILKKGDVLFHQGEIGSLFRLHTGLLKVIRLKENGTPYLVNLLLPGEIFPHHSLLSANEYFGSVIAGVLSEVEVLSKTEWYAEIAQNPEHLYQVALNLQDKLRMMQERIDQLTEVKPAVRMILFRQWFNNHFPYLILEEVLTQDEIGQFIGVTRETVNRLLRKE